jgi:hypothetical protein
MLAQADLVNYNKDAKVVYVGYEFEYIDGHLGSDSVVSGISVLGCGSDGRPQGFNSTGIKLDPLGSSYTDSPRFLVTQNSTILGARK